MGLHDIDNLVATASERFQINLTFEIFLIVIPNK